MPTLGQRDATMARAWLDVPVTQQFGRGGLSLTDPVLPFRMTGMDAAVYQPSRRYGDLISLRCPLSDTFNSTDAVHCLAMECNPGLDRDWLARGVTFHTRPENLTRTRDQREGSSQEPFFGAWDLTHRQSSLNSIARRMSRCRQWCPRSRPYATMLRK